MTGQATGLGKDLPDRGAPVGVHIQTGNNDLPYGTRGPECEGDPFAPVQVVFNKIQRR